MQAIQMTRFGGPEVLELVELPDPVAGPGQIVIEVDSAAVNFSDIMRRRNDAYPFPTELPFSPGCEVAGRVASLGEGVDGPPVGTDVFAIANGDATTGYSQYVLAVAEQVVPVPDGISLEQASGLSIVGITAMLILTDRARLAEGESVLVGGAGGGVGMVAIQLAKALGAGTVVGAASTEERRAAALAAGAGHVVDTNSDGWEHEAVELTGGMGVDVVLEMSGGETFGRMLSTLAPFGRMVVYGRASGEAPSFDADAQHRFFYVPALSQELSTFNLGAYFGFRPERAGAAMGRVIELAARGELDVPVGETLPLADAAEAHRRVEARETTGKVILKPWA